MAQEPETKCGVGTKICMASGAYKDGASGTGINALITRKNKRFPERAVDFGHGSHQGEDRCKSLECHLQRSYVQSCGFLTGHYIPVCYMTYGSPLNYVGFAVLSDDNARLLLCMKTLKLAAGPNGMESRRHGLSWT